MQEFSDQQLYKILNNFEYKRLEQIKKLNNIKILLFIFYLSIPIILFFNHTDLIIIAIYLVIALVMILLIYEYIYKKKNKSFKKELKKACIQNILQTIPYQVTYTNNSTTSQDNYPSPLMEESELFPYHEYRQIDDAFHCQYKDIFFRVSENKLSLTSRADNYDNLAIFNGLIIYAKTKQEFLNKILVLPKGIASKKDSILKAVPMFIVMTLGPALYHFSALSNWKFLLFYLIIIVFCVLIVLNDTKSLKAFYKLHSSNHKYTIYSSNKLSNTSIVDSVLEQISKANDLKELGTIRFSFFRKYMLIAIDTKKDFFEIGDLKVSCTDSILINEFMQDFDKIFKLIDILIKNNIL